MKKTIFKVGDKVFDALYGFGEVISVVDGKSYPIKVDFKNHAILYKECGRHFLTSSNPSLSFTEYDYVNGGFSQERPIEIPKRGQIVWVRDYINERWHITHFIKMNKLDYVTSFRNQYNDICIWQYLTTKNPYEN